MYRCTCSVHFHPDSCIPSSGLQRELYYYFNSIRFYLRRLNITLVIAFNAQSTVLVISGRNTTHHYKSRVNSNFTVPKPLQTKTVKCLKVLFVCLLKVGRAITKPSINKQTIQFQTFRSLCLERFWWVWGPFIFQMGFGANSFSCVLWWIQLCNALWKSYIIFNIIIVIINIIFLIISSVL